LSHRQIARALSLSRSGVQTPIERAEKADLCWPLPTEMTDAALESHLYPPPTAAIGRPPIPLPDWAEVRRELTSKHVTPPWKWQRHHSPRPQLPLEWLTSQNLGWRDLPARGFRPLGAELHSRMDSLYNLPPSYSDRDEGSASATVGDPITNAFRPFSPASTAILGTHPGRPSPESRALRFSLKASRRDQDPDRSLCCAHVPPSRSLSPSSITDNASAASGRNRYDALV
jgi:hypothetical protein